MFIEVAKWAILFYEGNVRFFKEVMALCNLLSQYRCQLLFMTDLHIVAPLRDELCKLSTAGSAGGSARCSSFLLFQCLEYLRS